MNALMGCTAFRKDTQFDNPVIAITNPGPHGGYKIPGANNALDFG
jgi:hypothetical protein